MMELVLWCAAFVVGCLSAGRITRLLVADEFPPIVALRILWDDKTEDSGWNVLFHCHWCMSMWVTLPIGIWAWLSNLHPSWWIVNTILAASYVVPMIVERDEKE